MGASNQEEIYAEQWNLSEKYFYEKNRYHWMANKLEGYDTVLEIGCGTGYSTLALVELGHTVIAIDKNPDCIKKAKELVEKNGKSDRVIFIEGDITDEKFRQTLNENCEFDIVVCWNVGTAWTEGMLEKYLPYLLEYGLNILQIQNNQESSYAELIIWITCNIAAKNNVPVQIIERCAEVIDSENGSYYEILGKEFGYSKISYDNLKCDSISSEGRMLITNGVVNDTAKVDLVLVSILMKEKD